MLGVVFLRSSFRLQPFSPPLPSLTLLLVSPILMTMATGLPGMLVSSLCVVALVFAIALPTTGMAAEEEFSSDADDTVQKVSPSANYEALLELDADAFKRLFMEEAKPFVLCIVNKEKATSKKRRLRDAQTEGIVANLVKVSKALSPIVDTIVADSESGPGKEILQTYGIGNTPVILFFNSDLMPVQGAEGSVAKMPLGYQGDGTPGAIVRWVIQSLSNTPIHRVYDDHTMAHFLNHMSHAGFPKMLLVSNETVTSPAFKSAAQRYRFGCLSAVASSEESPEIIKRYEVTEFPTLIGFSPSGSSFTISKLKPPHTTSSAPDDVTAFNNVLEFYERIAMPAEARRERMMAVAMDEKAQREKAAEQAKMGTVLPPIVINSREEWKEKCLKRKKGACIAIFREIDEFRSAQEGGLKEHMDIYANVAKTVAVKAGSTPLQIVVVDGLTNWKLVQALGIVNGIPDAVAIYPAKKSYFNFVGALSEKNLVHFFIDKVVRHKLPRAMPKKLPKFVPTKSQEQLEAEEDGGVSDEM